MEVNVQVAVQVSGTALGTPVMEQIDQILEVHAIGAVDIANARIETKNPRGCWQPASNQTAAAATRGVRAIDQFLMKSSHGSATDYPQSSAHGNRALDPSRGRHSDPPPARTSVQWVTRRLSCSLRASRYEEGADRGIWRRKKSNR